MFIVVARQDSVTSKSEQIEFERQIDSNEQNVFFQTIPTSRKRKRQSRFAI